MRLFLLTSLTMTAFAANSVLNRMALADGDGDAVTFAAIRAISGAIMLLVLVGWRRQWPAKPDWRQALWLMVYLYGFSMAYLALGSGIGALILFGMVQITMFVGAALAREALPPRRLFGASLAFAGLVWLLWPTQHDTLPLVPVGFMVLAGIGWGLYSLGGRSVRDPLGQTALNFAIGAPLAVALLMLKGVSLSNEGVLLAILSGALTSGLGYALWYQIMPQLGSGRAAAAQLTVPVIAMAAGVVLLQEALTGRFIIAALLVLGGVTISVMPGRK